MTWWPLVAQVMAGDPVEINPSTGNGYRVMSVDEWAARFKRSEEFPDCLACGGTHTKEHAFTQVGPQAAHRYYLCGTPVSGRS
jgi:hypothetical protein